MEFTLKDWELSYAKDLVKHANNKAIYDNLRNSFPYPYSINDAKEFIKYCLLNNHNNIFKAIMVNDEAVGSISVMKQEDIYCKSGELGYWLSQDYWNLGIITKSIKKISKLAFNELDIVRIYAEPFAFNIASRKALEKAGFTLEAVLKNSIYKNNLIMDSCIYAMVL